MRLRVSLRLLMVVVALAALGIGPIYRYVQTLRQRSRDYAESAQVSALLEKVYLARAKSPHYGPLEKEASEGLADWHAKRSAKYKRAIYRPWILVEEPTPPPPMLPPKDAPNKPITEIANKNKEKVDMTKLSFDEASNRAIQKIRDHSERLRRRQADGLKTKMSQEELDQILRDLDEFRNARRNDRASRKAAREAEIARFRGLATP